MNLIDRVTQAIKDAVPDLTAEAASRIAQAVLAVLIEEAQQSSSAQASAIHGLSDSSDPTRRDGESDEDWAAREAFFRGRQGDETDDEFGRRVDALREKAREARKAREAQDDAMSRATAVWGDVR